METQPPVHPISSLPPSPSPPPPDDSCHLPFHSFAFTSEDLLVSLFPPPSCSLFSSLLSSPTAARRQRNLAIVLCWLRPEPSGAFLYDLSTCARVCLFKWNLASSSDLLPPSFSRYFDPPLRPAGYCRSIEVFATHHSSTFSSNSDFESPRTGASLIYNTTIHNRISSRGLD
ncbi:hypothetical protein VTJ04DRAFT_771 [Mycothermus thermophilus]|uniref:uncharacterized protein n=1 Tax=Humicola insolens TaxID=85995 RepID=UPI0037429502